jgi:DNA-binding NarL/FixJ family response regulator
MAPLRVLIRSGSARALANYRDLLGSAGAVVVVTDPALADVTLVELTGKTGDPPAPDGPVGPVLLLVGDGVGAAPAGHWGGDELSVVSDDISRDQLVAALRAVASGLVVRDPHQARGPAHLRAEISSDAEAGTLTQREREILRLLGDGLGNRDIAKALGLSDHTVKFHLHSIFTKLGVRSRTEAVSAAVRRGLLLL